MAHALWEYKGKCSSIHGHTYKIIVSVRLKDNNSLKDMVMDFNLLKKIVKETIIEKFDHSLLLYKNAKYSNQIDLTLECFQKVYFLEFQPTCENLVKFFSDLIIKKLPENIKLVSIKLWEGIYNYAEMINE